ncbi:hypothetical protein GF357_04540, partial [Candidatus Dojkabacteria bacterium]|nr:hypothetical protein [Candidatus Dojkabacteria bacterium]
MNSIYNIIKFGKQSINIPFDGEGKLSVGKGDAIKPGDELFTVTGSRIGETYFIPQELGVSLDQVREYVLRLDGEYVSKGDVIAEKVSGSGLTAKQVVATRDGIISLKRLHNGFIDILTEKKNHRFESKFNGKVLRASRQFGVELQVKTLSLNCFASKLVKRSYLNNDYVMDADLDGDSYLGEIDVIKDGTSVYTVRDLGKKDFEHKIVFAGRYLYPDLAIEVIERGALAIVAYSMDYEDFKEINGNILLIGGFGQLVIDEFYINLIDSVKGKFGYVSSNFKDEFQVLDGEITDKIFPSLNKKYFDGLRVDSMVISTRVSDYGCVGRVVGFEDDGSYAVVKFSSGQKGIISVNSLRLL